MSALSNNDVELPDIHGLEDERLVIFRILADAAKKGGSSKGLMSSYGISHVLAFDGYWNGATEVV